MDKTLAIIFTATVLLITAVTTTVFFTGSLEDSEDSLSDLKCQAEADRWEEGQKIDAECLDFLEEEQETALADAFKDDLI